MDNYLAVNIGLIAGVLVVLGLVTWVLWRWRRWRKSQILRRLISEVEVTIEARRQVEHEVKTWADAITKARESSSDERLLDKAPYITQIIDRSDDLTQQALASTEKSVQILQSILHLVRVLNIATSVVALIPLGLGLYSLIVNNQVQALTFSLAALATLIVTKGGLFLLTLVLIPFLKAVPAGAGTTAGGIIVHKVWRWLERRRKPKSGE